MRIGIDVDGVLADFNKMFIKRTIAVTGRDLFPPWPFDIPCWDYPEHYGYSADETSAIWKDIEHDATFWYSLDEYPGAFASVLELDRLDALGHDVYFVTSRPGIKAKKQTERWLISRGIRNPTVLISGAKGVIADVLDLEYYIDDRDKNVLDVAARRGAKTRTYLMNRPWNVQLTNLGSIIRVDSVEEMFR
jgi:5'(3')-deoxyribonucleotidase